MSEDNIVAIIIAVLGGGGLWTFAAMFFPRREPPIDKDQADIVAAHESQQIALTILNDVQKELRDTRTDAAAEQRARLRLEGEVRELREDREVDRRDMGLLRTALQTVLAWGQNLQEHWDELRRHPAPPPLPVVRVPPRRGSSAAGDEH